MPGLQRAHASSPKKPHAFFFGRAVDDFNLIICRGVIERITGVLLKELEECVPPWVVQEREKFLSEGLQLVDADRLNGLLNRFAPRREDTFNVKVFRFHNVYLVLVSVTEGKSLALSYIAFLRASAFCAGRSALREHLRLFAAIDFGQFTVTRLIARFLQANRGATAELRYTNRPLHMIQEGYDAGVIAGSITDESVIARPAGKVVRYLVAAPG